MKSASGQCIQRSTAATPTSESTATRNLPTELAMNWSSASMSVTKCEATAPLPSDSYSAIDTRSSRPSRSRRMR